MKRLVSLGCLIAFLAPAPSRAQELTERQKQSLLDQAAKLTLPGPGQTIVVAAADRGDTVLYRASGKTTVFIRQRQVWTAIPASSYAEVCVTPCVATVPADGWYRFGGAGGVASGEFRLPPVQPNLQVKATGVVASVGSASARRAGWFTFTMGAALTLVGGASLIGGVLRDPEPNATKYYNEPMALQRDEDSAQLARTLGLITMPIGGVLMLVGGILVASNSTDVLGLDGRTVARAPRRPGLLRF